MVFCLTMDHIRGIEFVTRKITDGVAQIFYGKKQSISLGNINQKEIGVLQVIMLKPCG